MISEEAKKKINLIKIQTKKALSGSMVGDFSTATKGSGLEFHQLDDYSEDDDIRFVDWSSSARHGKLLVRQYLEERNRTIIIAVDVSSSTFFSSSETLKYDAISQIAAILTLVSDYGKDNVGLLLFSDKIHEFIPSKRGAIHVNEILQKIFSQKLGKNETDISVALNYLGKNVRRDSLVFVISDFISDGFEKALINASKKVSLVAIRCLDKLECEQAFKGTINLSDIETGKRMIVDGSKSEMIIKYLNKRITTQNRLFKRCRVELLDIKHNQSYISGIVKFFKKRMLY